MAERSGPFDTGGFVEDDWAGFARSFANDGVIFFSAFTELKMTAGSGFNGSLAIGKAFVRGFYYFNDAVKTLDFTKGGTTPPPGTAGQSRIDMLVLALDRAANTITTSIKTGVAAGVPTAPVVQQDDTLWEMPIAQVIIANGASALGTITDLRQAAYVPPAKRWATVKKNAATSCANTVVQTIALDPDLGNTTDMFDNATDEFICPINGIYAGHWNARLDASANSLSARPEVNGSESFRQDFQANTTQENGHMITFRASFKAGDRIKLRLVNFGTPARDCTVNTKGRIELIGPSG